MCRTFAPASSAGRRIAIILSSVTPDGRTQRVISGTVRGHAERTIPVVGPVLDVEMEDCYSWTDGHDGDGHPSALPPRYKALIRVAVLGSADETLAMLERSSGGERHLITAVEIPFATCWRCGRTTSAQDVHCGQCGIRQRTGVNMTVSVAKARPAGASCRVCLTPIDDDGRCCTRCGAPVLESASAVQLPRLAALFRGEAIETEVFLVGGRRRYGAWRVRCEQLKWAPAEGANRYMLLGQFTAWRADDEAVARRLGGSEALEAARTWARIHLPGEGGLASLAAIENWLAGNPLTVSDWSPANCTACGERCSGDRSRSRNRECSGCGARLTIVPCPGVRLSGRPRTSAPPARFNDMSPVNQAQEPEARTISSLPPLPARFGPWD